MWKKCKVVMLPTNGKAILGLGLSKQGKLIQYDLPVDIENDQYFQKQHLYILSDNEIKEGDWYYDEENNIIDQLHKNELPMSYDEKVITSTDSSLLQLKSYKSGANINMSLPSIPQSFIDLFVSEYNKGNKIEEVMVKYIHDNGETFVPMNTLYLWLNTDNTINIKSVKNSWTREEVTILLLNFGTDLITWAKEYIKDPDIKDFKQMDWIENNLQ
jgi:hypothetical protein